MEIIMRTMKCFPDAEEELIPVDFSLSREVLAVAVLVADPVADLAVSAAAEVSAAAALPEDGDLRSGLLWWLVFGFIRLCGS